MTSSILSINQVSFIDKLTVLGAGGGNRTRFLALGRLHNSRYTTPAYFMEPPIGFEPMTPALRKRCSSQLS